MARGRRENNAQTGVASVAPPHYCDWGSRPFGRGSRNDLTKASKDWEEGVRKRRIFPRRGSGEGVGVGMREWG